MLKPLISLIRRTSIVHSKILIKIADGMVFNFFKNEIKWGIFNVKVDPRDRYIARKLILFREYEKYEISHLCSHIKPGDQVLDVGAHWGLYSLHLCHSVGIEGKVILVEPDPDNVNLLIENLQRNKLHNYKILKVAFGNYNGTGNLFQVKENRGNLSLSDVRNTGRSIKVSVKKSGEALKELGIYPRIAKIDAQGAEMHVIANLNYLPEIMLIEFAPKLLNAMGTEPSNFLKHISSKGYKINLIDPVSGQLQKVETGFYKEIIRKCEVGNYSLIVNQ